MYYKCTVHVYNYDACIVTTVCICNVLVNPEYITTCTIGIIMHNYSCDACTVTTVNYVLYFILYVNPSHYEYITTCTISIIMYMYTQLLQYIIMYSILYVNLSNYEYITTCTHVHVYYKYTVSIIRHMYMHMYTCMNFTTCIVMVYTCIQ